LEACGHHARAGEPTLHEQRLAATHMRMTHSIGVESISQVSSAYTSMSVASSRMIACSCTADLRSRLLYPA
jgi:hypothetical protein